MALVRNRTPQRTRLVLMLALVRGLPAVARWGVALTLTGLAIDIAVHSAGEAAASGTAAAVGHLVTLVGMVVAIAGVVPLGLRGSRGAEGRRR